MDKDQHRPEQHIKKDKYDVIVAGGGVAALTAAIQLARHPWRVLVVRPHKANTTYGESLDWEAPRLLRALGVDLEGMISRDEATLKRGAVASYAPRDERFEIGFAWIYRALMALVGRAQDTLHIDRAALDQELERLALAAGVSFMEGKICQVEHQAQQDAITGIIIEGGRRLEARAFIDATGRARVLARAAGVEVEPFGARKVALSARQEHDYDHKGTRIRLDDHGEHVRWIWDIHSGQRRTDIGLVVLASELKQWRHAQGETSALARALVARHPDLSWLPEQWATDAAKNACSFQDQVSLRLYGANWWLVGEAAAVIDPILSSGMTFALRSALAATSALSAQLEQRPKARALAARLERKLRMHSRSVNALIEHIWYQNKPRQGLGLKLNVLLVLMVNFNLNHIHARRWSQRPLAIKLLGWGHQALDRLVIAGAAGLERISQRKLEAAATKANKASTSPIRSLR